MSTNTTLADTKQKPDIREEIEQVYRLQKANRWNVATTTAEQRIAKLKKLREVIVRRKADLEQAMWEDFHKPAAEVEITEYQPVLAELKHNIHSLKKWMKPKKVATPMHLFGTKSFIRCEPKGMVLILAPWNYPFNLLMCPLVAAIGAGNAVMMRPSDKVQKTSLLMKAIVEEVFPKNEAAIFLGPYSVGDILLEYKYDHIFFTGSTTVGKKIMAIAAENLSSVTLELGGQSPVVVDETADIAAAAARLTWGKYINGGQTCVAPNHVFVHESVAGRFIEDVKMNVAKQYGATDEARHATADFARIVDTRSHQRLSGLIDKSVAAGAKLEIGGARVESERYLAPTVLSGVTTGHPVMSEEIFGPVMPVITYRDLHEVTDHIQANPKPLAMYIFSKSKQNIERLLANSSAGGTVVNNVLMHFANDQLPFGGVNDSGLGNYHGLFGFKTFSHERAVMHQGAPASSHMIYPPYTGKVKRMISLMTKLFS